MAGPEISSRDTAVMPSVNEYVDKFGIDPKYLVTLSVKGDNTLGSDPFYVTTSLDQTFGVSMGSHWDAPFANVMSEMIGKVGQGAGVAATVAKGFGIETKNRNQTAQMWQNSDPVSFTIPFTFIAVKDPKTEVADKVRNLLKLAAPSMDGFLLRAPGPTMAGQVSNKLGGRLITLYLGKFLTLENCIIKRVDAQFDSIIGTSGIPLKAKVTVDIESYYTCFTVQDVDALFGAKK